MCIVHLYSNINDSRKDKKVDKRRKTIKTKIGIAVEIVEPYSSHITVVNYGGT